jgi:hypothetical protein
MTGMVGAAEPGHHPERLRRALRRLPARYLDHGAILHE